MRTDLLPEGKEGGPGVRECMNSMEYVLLSHLTIDHQEVRNVLLVSEYDIQVILAPRLNNRPDSLE